MKTQATSRRATAIHRMLVLLLTLASALLAIVWIWHRYWEGVLGSWRIHAAGVEIAHWGYDRDLVISFPYVRDAARQLPLMRSYEFGKFGFAMNMYMVQAWMPFWFPVFAFLSYPLSIVARAIVRRRLTVSRQLQGRCVRCGYDLTGLTEMRCPECATAFVPGQVASRTRWFLRTGDLVLLFLCLGIGSAFISAMIMLMLGTAVSRYLGPLDAAVILAEWSPYLVLGGVINGGVWGAFGIPLLHKKPVGAVVRRLAPTTALAVACVALLSVLFYLAGVYSIVFPMSLLLPTAIVIGTCVRIRRTLDDVPISIPEAASPHA